MTLEPVVAHGLERRNALADSVHKNLSPAARDRAQPGLGKLGNDFLQRQPKDLAKMNKLAWAEPVNVDLGKLAFDVRQQIQVPLQGQFGVMAALHQDLRAAEGDRLLNLPVHFVEGDDIRVRILLRPIKGAELAIDIADIRIIDIAIDDVSDDLVAAAIVGLGAGQLAAAIRQRAQVLQRQRIEAQGLRRTDAVPGPGLVQQSIQCNVAIHPFNRRVCIHPWRSSTPD